MAGSHYITHTPMAFLYLQDISTSALICMLKVTLSVIILHVTRWHCDSVHKLLSSVTGGEHIYLSAVSAQRLVWV